VEALDTGAGVSVAPKQLRTKRTEASNPCNVSAHAEPKTPCRPKRRQAKRWAQIIDGLCDGPTLEEGKLTRPSGSGIVLKY
jgi:hypothetical protein